VITKRRSLAKSITWRLIAIAVTFIVGYVMTGSWQFAVSLSLISNLINFVLYYIHERFWLKVNWGRK
jgi:adenylylsulfate kinase